MTYQYFVHTRVGTFVTKVTNMATFPPLWSEIELIDGSTLSLFNSGSETVAVRRFCLSENAFVCSACEKTGLFYIDVKTLMCKHCQQTQEA